jgi:hypothetical protein
MEWSPPTRDGIVVPKWRWLMSTYIERERQDEGYDGWG